MKFVAQTVDGKVTLDQVFELERALEYWKWKGDPFELRYCELEDLVADPEWCPVGTIEFVHKGMDYEYSALNVPRVLCNFDPDYPCEFSPINPGPWFIKTYKIKDEQNGWFDKWEDRPEGLLQVRSEIKDIKSEWRVFVMGNEILAVQPYSGDPLVTFVPRCVRDMVKLMEPMNLPAYTLDIYTRWKEDWKQWISGPMEVHRFYSCGLYGFSDYAKYPLMLWRTFLDLKRDRNEDF